MFFFLYDLGGSLVYFVFVKVAPSITLIEYTLLIKQNNLSVIGSYYIL